ncbi:tetratricopeptide repeat protein [Azospirillum sp. sgz302134]
MATIAEALVIAFDHHEAGRLAEADILYGRILEADPAQVTALHLLGVLRCQTQRPDEAVPLLRKAVALDAANPCPRYDLARARLMQGRVEDAAAGLRQTLALDPGHAEALLHLARALEALGREADALDGLERLLRLQPDHREARDRADRAVEREGQALLAAGHTGEAIARLTRPAAAAVGLPLLLGHGVSLHHARRPAEAARFFRALLAAQPDHTPTMTILATLASTGGRDAEAFALADRAFRLAPDRADAAAIRGDALHRLGWDREAVASYREAVRLAPDLVDAHWNMANALLRLGDYAEGWAEYEWRWRSGALAGQHRPFIQPRWAGEPLSGKTILVHAEQGMGDTIQFIRFLDRVVAAGPSRVYLEAHGPLRPLLEMNTDPALVSVISRASDFPGVSGLPDTDVHLPVMSLGTLFCPTVAAIPARVPYLRSAPDRRALWTQRLRNAAPGAALRCGLVWSGRPQFHDNASRSLGLAALAPLAAVEGVALFSLQVGEAAARQVAEVPFPIIDLSADLTSFAETAAVLDSLDLFITVDTGVAHLAGALARPVWILLHHGCDWRWFKDRDDSPWYPTARLFRQSVRRDWSVPVAEAASALRRLVADYSAGLSRGAGGA